MTRIGATIVAVTAALFGSVFAEQKSSPAGGTSLTNRDLAQLMVAVSDNAAANILIDRVGMQNVNATLRNLGLTKTMLRRKMMDIAAARRGDENVSTPQEMTRLLEAIYKGKALDEELAEIFMKQLSTRKEGL